MADAESDDLRGWKSFFDEVASFIEGIERQYGVANENFTEYVVDRLELIIRSCTVISDRFAAVTVESLSEDDRSVVLEYQSSVRELTTELRDMLNRWREYGSVLDSTIMSSQVSLSYQMVTSGHRGRPRFEVSLEQLQYLKSLFFTWSEIAALLGVSRMTIYR